MLFATTAVCERALEFLYEECSMKEKRDSVGGLFDSRAKTLELSIDRYLTLVEQSVLLLEDAIKKYLNDRIELFEHQRSEIDKTEREADNLRREIKHRLYSEMLIPDSRGDVLALIETLDNVTDRAKDVSSHFSIEKPEIYPFLKGDFRELMDACVKTVGEVTLAVRAFFRELYRVTEHVEKVHYWEHQADEIEERIKRKAFQSEGIKLFSKRVHMRYFAERISEIADEAEAVADRLAVYSIKRSL